MNITKLVATAEVFALDGREAATLLFIALLINALKVELSVLNVPSLNSVGASAWREGVRHDSFSHFASMQSTGGAFARWHNPHHQMRKNNSALDFELNA